ncbi:MAG: ABC-2 family transporter protein [Anaerolineae bacterium]|nr:ABC-2 family transporter protein [Anaerolineae bacterium]
MRQLFRIVATFLRLGALNELEYRANFFIQAFQAVLNLLVALGGLQIVFAQTETLGGWQPAELLALVGVYQIVGGLIQTVINPSMQRFMEDVRKGTLDFALTKPADAQLLVSVREFRVWRMIDVLLGVTVLIVALVRLGAQVGALQALLFGITLLCGSAIVYSFWLILATFSFWFVRVENILVIFRSMYQAGRWPVGIYPRWLRVTLTFIVPVAFAVTIPARGLVGRLDLTALLQAAALALVLLLVSRLFWRIGLRAYSGASA